MFGSDHPFNEYANKLKVDIDRLEKLTLPNPLKIRISKNQLDNIGSCLSELSGFNELKEKNDVPVIYYFEIDSIHGERIFNLYKRHKEINSAKRIGGGVKKETGFINLSFVPSVFKESKCLYVGSVKNGIVSRLKNHLGYGKSGRTGGLYLSRILREMSFPENIIFNAYPFEKSFVGLTEHIECVFHDKLVPILGRRAFYQIDKDLY